MPFEEIFGLSDPAAARQAFEMARTFEPAVNSNGWFDISQARAIVREDPAMSEVNVLEATLRQDHDDVSKMVDSVTETLTQFLGLPLPDATIQQLAASIEYAFVSLSTQTTDGWIFYKKEEGHSTTYQYNIFYAFQDAALGNFLYGAPLGMTIKVDRDYERVLFITLKDKVSYSVRLESVMAAEYLETVLVSRVADRVRDTLRGLCSVS